MNPKDISTFEIGESCFGEILTINNQDYAVLQKQHVISFINYKADLLLCLLIIKLFN